jgi:hypothetical protein
MKKLIALGIAIAVSLPLQGMLEQQLALLHSQLVALHEKMAVTPALATTQEQKPTQQLPAQHPSVSSSSAADTKASVETKREHDTLSSITPEELERLQNLFPDLLDKAYRQYNTKSGLRSDDNDKNFLQSCLNDILPNYELLLKYHLLTHYQQFVAQYYLDKVQEENKKGIGEIIRTKIMLNAYYLFKLFESAVTNPQTESQFWLGMQTRWFNKSTGITLDTHEEQRRTADVASPDFIARSTDQNPKNTYSEFGLEEIKLIMSFFTSIQDTLPGPLWQALQQARKNVTVQNLTTLQAFFKAAATLAQEQAKKTPSATRLLSFDLKQQRVFPQQQSNNLKSLLERAVQAIIQLRHQTSTELTSTIEAQGQSIIEQFNRMVQYDLIRYIDRYMGAIYVTEMEKAKTEKKLDDYCFAAFKLAGLLDQVRIEYPATASWHQYWKAKARELFFKRRQPSLAETAGLTKRYITPAERDAELNRRASLGQQRYIDALETLHLQTIESTYSIIFDYLQQSGFLTEQEQTALVTAKNKVDKELEQARREKLDINKPAKKLNAIKSFYEQVIKIADALALKPEPSIPTSESENKSSRS